MIIFLENSSETQGLHEVEGLRNFKLICVIVYEFTSIHCFARVTWQKKSWLFAKKIVEPAVQIAIYFCDISELVCPIWTCNTPKFAQLKSANFVWNDPVPKNAEKTPILPKNDFWQVQQKLE